MREYTLIAAISVLVTIAVDRLSRAKLLKRKDFYIFLLVIFVFKFLVNGYLTGQGVVLYNPRFFLGLRLGSIPLEDFLFGFSMVALTIIFWERFKKAKI
ncbi:MAG TPA: lycopene cyclase domain-containing protein [Patescibacteria group bacterium]|nr:lycopene cyclase domain-containing protein [Patescibacteria group bacterium]